MTVSLGRAWREQSLKYVPGKRDTTYLVLAGIFVAHAIIAELVGGKLIEVGGRLLSVGVIPWPVVFVATDLINEYYGPRAVRRLTLLTMALIVYTFAIVYLCILPTAAGVSPVSDEAFRAVFGQSLWIIVGSVIAFAISQLVDAAVFVMVAARTAGRLLWMRAVGSTVVSQLIDTFVINLVAFGLPGRISLADVVELSIGNYVYKFVVAIGTLPLIYLGHSVLDRYLGSNGASASA